MLLAAKAEGVTVIHNAAREPEIITLVRFLRAMGAEIYGEGTGSILIEGVSHLHGAVFTVPSDRIEGGTFLCAAAMTGGELYLRGLEREQMGAVLAERGVAVRAGMHCAPLAHDSAGTLKTGTIRLSVSDLNTLEECGEFLQIFRECMA